MIAASGPEIKVHYLHGIVCRCSPCTPASSRRVKYRAYGSRDEEYFFLKIRAAFPGIPR
jgi:transposase